MSELNNGCAMLDDKSPLPLFSKEGFEKFAP
jgi:hypothetical protein